MIVKSPTGNLFVERMRKNLLPEEIDQLEYVILTHTDNLMIRKLAEGFLENTVAIISVPQHSWDMQGSEADTFMEWLIHETEVARVILAGHSYGGWPAPQRGGMPAEISEPTGPPAFLNEQAETEFSYSRAWPRSRASEQHFVQQLKNLRSLPCLRNCSSDLVQGVFYRAESNTFFYFDPKHHQFRTLDKKHA